MNNKNINFYKYQNDIFHVLNNTKNKAFLMYHSIFHDYIKTSLFAAVILHKKYNNKQKIIVVTNSMSNSFYIEKIQKYNLDYSLFQFMTHRFFEFNIKRNSRYVNNQIIILDKAHYYRNINKSTEAVIKGLSYAKFVLMITTSLFVNNTDDIIPILSILHNVDLSIAKDLFINSRDDSIIFDNLYKNRLSMHRMTDNTFSNSQFKIYENNVPLYMSADTYKKYNTVENELIPLMNSMPIKKFLYELKKHTQQITLNNKLDWIKDKLSMEHKNIILLNNYNENESDIVSTYLNLHKIKYISISDKQSLNYKKLLFRKFNNDKDTHVIVLNKIDIQTALFFKDIKNIFCVDPRIDNEQFIYLLDNIILSRKLDKKIKRLDIYTLILNKPKNTNLLDKLKNFFKTSEMKAVDVFIQTRNDNNKKFIKQLIKKLKNVSI